MRAQVHVDGLWEMVFTIPPNLRKAAFAQLLDEIERLYGEYDLPAPAFVHVARKGLRKNEQ